MSEALYDETQSTLYSETRSTLYGEKQSALVVTIVTINLSGVTFYFGTSVVVLQKKIDTTRRK